MRSPALWPFVSTPSGAQLLGGDHPEDLFSCKGLAASLESGHRGVAAPQIDLDFLNLEINQLVRFTNAAPSALVPPESQASRIEPRLSGGSGRVTNFTPARIATSPGTQGGTEQDQATELN
jgi:hypothetical protein